MQSTMHGFPCYVVQKYEGPRDITTTVVHYITESVPDMGKIPLGEWGLINLYDFISKENV
jgi:hypothetical protein